MPNTDPLRDHIVKLLSGGQAYETFEEIAADVPPDKRGVAPQGAEHSAWQVLEHMRRAQRDILDFSRNEDGSYAEKRWPEDYWPTEAAPDEPDAWDRTVSAFLADRAELEALVLDGDRDPCAPFPWGDGKTLLREALLAADHASYHLGQIVVIRRLLG